MRGIFYNSKESLCSIWESGRMCYNILNKSNKYTLDYSEEIQLDISYDFVIFNHHFTVNNWITKDIIKQYNKPIFGIVTEVSFSSNPIEFSFQYFTDYIVLDPTIIETDKIHAFSRPIENYDLSQNKHIINYDIPQIFSFGFATEGKEWHKIVELTQNDYDNAVIHFNIPLGTYVYKEMHDRKINEIYTECRKIIKKPGIILNITHENLSKSQLVEICATKTINCFFYNRQHIFASGLSAVTDQAIASGRPLFVTSDQTFRHIHKYIDYYPNLTLKQCIEKTQDGVLKMKYDWSNENFLKKFENIISKKILFKVSCSIGDIIDKYSILELKQKYIQDEKKIVEIKKEMYELFEYRNMVTEKYVYFYNLLLHINELIWNDTDNIKKLNIIENTGYDNILLYSKIANTIFNNNQKRFRIKNYFNIFLDSNIKEQKSYDENACLLIINDFEEIYKKISVINYLCIEYDTVLFLSPFKDIIRKIFINPNIKFIDSIDNNNYKQIIIDNINICDLISVEYKEFYEFETIKYVACGLLGDFINQLSVINEIFYKTGKKGILYITDKPYEVFRLGLEKAYKDTFNIINNQVYIKEYKIHNSEKYDIHLSSWRDSPLLYNRSSLYDLFLTTFNINFGEKQWIKNIEYKKEWEDINIINTTQYRFPNNIFFMRYMVYNENCVFVTFDYNEFIFFCDRLNVDKNLIKCYIPSSLEELFIIIKSCKEFIGGLSAPLTIAMSMHKKLKILHTNLITDIIHNNLSGNIPNITDIY